MRALRRDEIVLGLAFSAEALYLHTLYFRHAGPLWRDEIDSAVVAEAPWAELLEKMEFSPFPAFWLLLVRGWAALFGDSVTSLRTLGVITGVLLLAAIWFALQTLGVRAPMLAVALAASTAVVVRFGDSLRAYGFGAAAGLVAMALLYRTCVEPTRKNFLFAAAASLIAAHTTYHNASLLFACCVAAAIVHRDRKRAAIVLGIGALCAASLLIYLPVIERANRWGELVRYDVDLRFIVWRFREAANFGGIGAMGWAILLVAAVVLGGWALWRSRGRDRALLFCIVVLVVYTIAQAGFLLALGYVMQVWYFLLWIVVAAVLVDAIVALALERQQPELQMLRGAAALFIIFIAFDGTRRVIELRTTNVDRVAAVLQHDATPRDYIIVYPWHLGVSFNRYYHGSTAWQTLPPLADHSVQRYDEVRKALTDTRERPVIAGAVAALRRGGRVWVVGFPLYLEQKVYVDEADKKRLRVLADIRWSREMDEAMRDARGNASMVVRPAPDTTGYESVALVRVDPPK